MDVSARLEVVEAENDLLRERIAELESLLGHDFMAPIEWGLTPAETRVFGALLARELATKRAIMAAIYRDVTRDEAEIKIVDVFVCKIRKKIAAHGFKIETRWGEGYFLTPATKAAVRALIEPMGEAA